MRTILIAVDFSDAADAVVDAALRVATAFGSQSFLVHVAAPDPEFVGYEAGPQHERDWRAGELRDEHSRLEQMATRFQQAGLDATPLLVQGPTVEKLLEEANRLQAELIVIGSHGHGRLHDLLVGSVAEGVLRHAGLPVLVVPVSSAS